MINFHKFGFLDARRLERFVQNKNYWLSRLNPVWIFAWSDYYKPEICFDGNFCFIRYLMPDIGMCYYPPLGDGDLLKGMQMIEADAEENGYDFYFAPVDEELSNKLNALGYQVKENEKFNNYIYSSEELAFPRKVNKNIKKFEMNHPNAYYKAIKKEEFPQILEFITKWRDINKDVKDMQFYAKLNSIKKLIEHMYEFNMLAMELLDDDGIYGIAIGTVLDNMAFLHLKLTLGDTIGASEVLLSSFAKVASKNARYINLEDKTEIKDMKKFTSTYKPLQMEKFYANFRL